VRSRIGLFASRQDGMVSTAQLRALGVTRRQIDRLVRDERWSAPYRGAFLLPGSHPIRGPVRAALVHRPLAVACAITAGRLHGLGGLPTVTSNGNAASADPKTGADPKTRTDPRRAAQSSVILPGEGVHLLAPRSAGLRAAQVGLTVHRGDCGPGERQVWRGIPVTAVERTLVDLVLANDRETAVAILDSALRNGRVADLDGLRAAMAGRRGAPTRHGWFALADGRAESALETRLRLLLADAGLPPEQLQWPVREADGPRIVARLDLAWPSHRVGVEADGAAFHDNPPALFRDRVRQNVLQSLGWWLLRFTWPDVLARPGNVAASVARMLQHPPPGRHPTITTR
jgi:hypothetical protein